MSTIRFTGEGEVFAVHRPEDINGLYFPLAGEDGLKSCVTPNLGGDSKLDQESFLMQPVSVDDLHNNRATRNFWVCTPEGGCWSATGASAEAEAARYTDGQDEGEVTAGFMWHRVTRASRRHQLEAEITSFVPVHGRVEIMKVRIRNAAEAPRRLSMVAAVYLYGRSADNLRDHRNVTSMLHRIRTVNHGVVVKPTMSFDERGHRLNHRAYYALGAEASGGAPAAFYPTLDEYLGLGGTFTRPEAVVKRSPGAAAGETRQGREAMGAMRFEDVTLAPGAWAEYVVLMGIADTEDEMNDILARYGTLSGADAALQEVKDHWQRAVNLHIATGDKDFDRLMRWVSFQPFLRRIFGCSFLPHHDYGRGGRGWRDLWQDCLSLLIMDPGDVRGMIVDNFGGVRLDGTNATIIGSGQGEFIADRNGIARVWMDHALWPWMTVKLYLDQTGDFSVLQETAPYFKDAQAMRGEAADDEWSDAYGSMQRLEDGAVYRGTVLEHLLIEHLPGFFEVGEHNHYRLRGADWNDALDMASHRGESVAFTCAYAGNLRDLADLLERLEARGMAEISLPEALCDLLMEDASVYDDIDAKKSILNAYLEKCGHVLAAGRRAIPTRRLAGDLRAKAQWIVAHVRAQEWIDDGADGGWFNSYYDDHGRAVEGFFDTGARMMLTGQVFSVMSGVADEAQVRRIVKSADRRLFDASIGGYRLNTDFGELKMDMGRQFGFAYGEKENGSVFCHMATMFGNALYRRGFAREGYRALRSLTDAALRFETSRIYPGIPEYFNNDGRGLYHYLTGTASWFMLTMVTEVFGVRGREGDLLIAPKLLREQFDENHAAAIRLTFAGKALEVALKNPDDLDVGAYAAVSAALNGETFTRDDRGELAIPRARIEALGEGTHRVEVLLG